MTKELIIYTDESVKTGIHYSNFYGGALVRSEHIDLIRTTLEQVKIEQNLYNEVKWARVTEQYLPKYEALINQFFSFVKQDQVKVRIMFTDNRRVPLRLTSYQREHGYFLLYYQFIGYIPTGTGCLCLPSPIMSLKRNKISPVFSMAIEDYHRIPSGT